MRTHKDLDVWKHSINIATEIYKATKSFPREEIYGLTAQMRRAAVSIPSNIAEGAARSGNKEFTKFLYIALGSASELDTQIEISKATGLGNPEKLADLQRELRNISKMLYGLIRTVRQ